ncbi:MAG: hypothetical protein LBT23_04065 [Synergistaceae bacterium]|jgi:uncharacterized membrane protein YcgQ (UPF0703/DUF1980 family)|nr:hypothetical protein [Synergistaceae bacterium]
MMRYLRKIFVFAFFVGFFLAPSAFADDEIIDIKEKMFVTQTNDVYVNPDEYMGRTIRLEGILGVIDDVDPICYFVYRFGPGCCGYDSNAGFEVVWHNENATYPSDNDWVEATGVLESYEDEGEPFIRLSLKSLIVKAERGKERVEQ